MKAKLVLLLAIIVVFVLVISSYSEHFASRREKAAAIYDWARSTADHTYNSYKESIEDANIVDYESLRNLFRDKSLTIANIENAI